MSEFWKTLNVSVSVRVSIAGTKHHDQKASWAGKFARLTLPYSCSLLQEVRMGTQAVLDPGGRN